MPSSDRGGSCSMKSAYCQILDLRNQIIKSHTVRYRDCAPVQIVQSSQCQAVSLLPRPVVYNMFAQSFATYHHQISKSSCKNHGFSIKYVSIHKFNLNINLIQFSFKDALLNWGKLLGGYHKSIMLLVFERSGICAPKKPTPHPLRAHIVQISC